MDNAADLNEMPAQTPPEAFEDQSQPEREVAFVRAHGGEQGARHRTCRAGEVDGLRRKVRTTKDLDRKETKLFRHIRHGRRIAAKHDRSQNASDVRSPTHQSVMSCEVLTGQQR
ncbi:hypothetical protein BV25DRAFT_704565 [Artomyces pyxidatus]|uniref:Uncharacterized protein n=1 Tax=Artomyces pyxidatus TaxID=48021 RepID=A0ACB8T031_9AGAM|nr:hypothetical protein BV25DRAFT_704565 [Artomyces pyxidatus]